MVSQVKNGGYDHESGDESVKKDSLTICTRQW